MKKRVLTLLIVLLLATLTAAPTFAQTTSTEGNITSGCVTNYDPQTDYFPEKITVDDATGFTVEYHNNYKVISVTNAFKSAPLFDYVLVQCGTPKPDATDFLKNTQFIEVPTGNVIAMSTTEIPHLVELGLLSHLVGLDSFDYVGNPEVRAMIDAKKLIAIGSGTTVDVEAALDAKPDLILTYGYDPEVDAYPVLMNAGIFTALASEYRESTPLGRAEWIKFTSLFYNVEAKANEVYGKISSEYKTAQELAASIPADKRPTILWSTFSFRSKAWSLPGVKTYVGALIRDAGGDIALADKVPDNNVPMSFEAVYDGAHDADIWITGTTGVNSIADFIALDSRYGNFDAVKKGSVWSNDLNLTPNGGNYYWELGVTNPNLILQDLVAIFHPELLPDHKFTFFRPITAK